MLRVGSRPQNHLSSPGDPNAHLRLTLPPSSHAPEKGRVSGPISDPTEQSFHFKEILPNIITGGPDRTTSLLGRDRLWVSPLSLLRKALVASA